MSIDYSNPAEVTLIASGETLPNDMGRWTRIEVYHVHMGTPGRGETPFVAVTIGKSNRPGEKDRTRRFSCATLAGALAHLGDSHMGRDIKRLAWGWAAENSHVMGAADDGFDPADYAEIIRALRGLEAPAIGTAPGERIVWARDLGVVCAWVREKIKAELMA